MNENINNKLKKHNKKSSKNIAISWRFKVVKWKQFLWAFFIDVTISRIFDNENLEWFFWVELLLILTLNIKLLWNTIYRIYEQIKKVVSSFIDNVIWIYKIYRILDFIKNILDFLSALL